MKLFKKKPKKIVTKYQVKVNANKIRHCINDIPTIKEAEVLIDEILKARKKWVKFGGFYFLTKDVNDIQLSSYDEKEDK